MVEASNDRRRDRGREKATSSRTTGGGRARRGSSAQASDPRQPDLRTDSAECPASGWGSTFSTAPRLGGTTRTTPGDADTGANKRQNLPIITSTAPEGGGTRSSGTLNSLASTIFDLDFYTNPVCLDRPQDLPAGRSSYLGPTQVTTDGSGNARSTWCLPRRSRRARPSPPPRPTPTETPRSFRRGSCSRCGPGVGGPGPHGQPDHRRPALRRRRRP